MLFLPFAGTAAPLAPLAGGSTGFLAAGGDLLLSDRDRGTVLSGLLVGGPLVTVLISTIQIFKIKYNQPHHSRNKCYSIKFIAGIRFL